MVEIGSGTIIDMIPSREKDEVSEWLKEYPNLQVVSRDGSQTYRAAISAAHPEAMQVSDRFHILKNLTERATDYFQKLFQGRISIPVTSETQYYRTIMQTGTKSQRYQLVQELRASGRSKRDISAVTGVSADTVNYYLSMDADNPESQSGRGRQHSEAVEKRRQRAARVRNLYEQGYSFRAISQETGFSYGTVKRYLDPNFNPVNAHYGNQREGKLEPYREKAFALRTNGRKYSEIYEILKLEGYTGTQDAIRGFISKERRIRKDLQDEQAAVPMEWVDKKWLTRLLYRLPDQIKGISREQLSAVFSKYPLAETIITLVTDFRYLLISRDLSRLLNWIKQVSSLDISELDAFLAGLKQDFDAVCNAITTDFNNGLAEGSINKLKVIKRIMFGRCSFALLKSKTLILDSLL